METNQNVTDSEISLRELIDALWRQKWVIVIISAVLFIAGFVVTFFMMENQYEAKATLQVSPTSIKEGSLENIDAIVEFYNKFPSMSVETYLEQITAPQVLQKTIEILNLKDEAGVYITRTSLLGMLSVSNAKNTNLIGITVNNKDPELAASIANTMGTSYISFMTDNNRKQSQQIATMLEEQLKAEEQKLDEKSKDLANYLSSSQSIEALQGEVQVYVSQLSEFKKITTEMEYRVAADKKILAAYSDAQIGEAIADVRLDLPLDTETADEKQNSSFRIQVPTSGDSISSIVYAFNMAQTQARLVENTENLNSLHVKIEEMKEQLAQAQSVLAEEEYKYLGIKRDVDLAQQTFNAYQQRHKEVVVAAAAEMGSTNIILSSSAVAPRFPVSPRRMLNLAISLMLGLMLGVFVAFAREYWKRSAVSS